VRQRTGIQQIPAYRRHSSGQARVTIAGRTHYLGKYGSKASRQRYDQLIAEWLASNRSTSTRSGPLGSVNSARFTNPPLNALPK
jgi:hypothetical protein